MKSAPPRVDHFIGWPLTLPLPPAANSTRSGLPCTSAADHVPMSAGLADALAAQNASAKANRIFLMGLLPMSPAMGTLWRGSSCSRVDYPGSRLESRRNCDRTEIGLNSVL